MSEQTNALHLARSRILELEEALRSTYEELLSLNKGIGWRDGEWPAVALARSVLNKENGNG